MRKKIYVALTMLMAAIQALSAQDYTIGTDDVVFSINGKEGQYYPSLAAFGTTYQCEGNFPVVLYVYGKDLDSAYVCQAEYATITAGKNSIQAEAVVLTPGGSKFNVVDKYSCVNAKGTIRLVRTVIVVTVSANDYAFNSLLQLKQVAGGDKSAFDYFMPGILYKDGTNMTATAIGSELTDEWILAREERLPLPMAMLMDQNTMVGISILDYNLNPVTTNDDYKMEHKVSDKMQYGSLGYCMNSDSPELVYCFPGSEGEHTYCDQQDALKHWAKRSHPVATTTTHTYTLELNITREEDFASTLSEHWNRGFDRYNPSVLSVNDRLILDYSIKLLDAMWLVNPKGAPGFPFSAYLSDGAVNGGITYNMGFVGMQPACGYYLYRYGLENKNDNYRIKGEQLLDFWTANAANSVGMPLVRWDVNGINAFQDVDGGGTCYNDLRNMQGGLEAIIEAWMTAEKYHPGLKASWLNYCKSAADWLCLKQGNDGSWAKGFKSDGSIYDNNKQLTSNVIRFLTQMYAVTHQKKYRNAAIKAGGYCYKQLHSDYKYIGAVLDNPHIKDRESGQKMLEAGLALYDMTKEDKWLDMAERAAYYTASYMYVWNIPAEIGGSLPISSDKTSIGMTLIATGHSGGDCGLSYNSFEYFRLYNITHNNHYLKIARLLEKNTKHTMDFDGKLGYKYHGMQKEAWRLVTPRGAGVNVWLPWVTATAIDPLYRMKDAFGEMEISDVLKLPSDEIKKLNDEFAKTQGLR